MKTNSKRYQEKVILAVVREMEKLEERVRNPVSIRLKEPIQRGWVRRYVLSREAMTRPDREVLSEILRDIGPETYSRRPDFLKKKRRGSRKLIEIEQPLHIILVDRWSIKRHPRPDEWKRYFHLEYKLYMGGFQWLYVFTDVHLFTLKVEPLWLTHAAVLDTSAISRLGELRAWFDHHVCWRRYHRLKGMRNWSWNTPMYEKLENQARRDLHRIRLDPEGAEGKPSVRWFPFSLLILSPRSPTEEALRSDRKGCGCKSCRGDAFAPVAWFVRAADLRSTQCQKEVWL